MFDIGGGELIVIVLGILLLFGPDKIPDIMKTVRSQTSKFEQAKKDIAKEITSITDNVKKDLKL